MLSPRLDLLLSLQYTITIMSFPNAPTSPLADEEIPRTIVYDPDDPFWRDTEDDDDDMDFVPAEEGGSDGAEYEEGDLAFHGMYMPRVYMLLYIY
jgi:hypothetical protein